jgi:hypothetical protein
MGSLVFRGKEVTAFLDAEEGQPGKLQMGELRMSVKMYVFPTESRSHQVTWWKIRRSEWAMGRSYHSCYFADLTDTGVQSKAEGCPSWNPEGLLLKKFEDDAGVQCLMDFVNLCEEVSQTLKDMAERNSLTCAKY